MPKRTTDTTQAGTTRRRRPASAAPTTSTATADRGNTDRGNTAAPSGPPGLTVRWVTITREYDADDRLISERTTDVRDTPLDHPSRPAPGFYL